jgi:hypothetical protein
MHAIVLAFATIVLALWPARSVAQCDQCEGDFNGDGQVTIDEIIVSVNNALNDCPAPGPRFVDNGDGTITDTKTGLQWEKKSDDGSVHDKGITYTWSAGVPLDPDGTTFTSFLATLNHEPCFAGHCDWRLPSVGELQSLVDYATFAPAIDAIFDTECSAGCTIEMCSCTALDNHWSATSSAESPSNVWNVDFNSGYVSTFEKTLPFYARAVRGGL